MRLNGRVPGLTPYERVESLGFSGKLSSRDTVLPNLEKETELG